MAVPPPSPSAILEAKQKVRRQLRALRRNHVALLRKQGRYDSAIGTLARRLLDHAPPGASIALYHAFGDEIDPASLARLLTARGHTLALPHVAADRTTMRFLAWHPDQPLVTGAFGLHQPHEDNAEIAPAMIVTPLVGFDRQGGRIGQGAGFYDRAFARLPGAIRIGMAWSVQEVANLPLDPWDVPLHAVATEQEWIPIGGAAA
ncbi:5-formyltetrahydrofolate cyclo-ligase [Sphingomonas sp. MMS24-J13]|uniref:5-formyltetrahydrofolate cyclo-ligase n=1 Tax=Sphingomonas sp. MMS24-J13 TaxID=3238686 RepID=UPI00384FD8B1